MAINQRDDMTVGIPEPITREMVLEAYREHLQTQGLDAAHVTWADLVDAVKPLHEAYWRDEISFRDLIDRIGLDLTQVGFLLSEIYGRGNWAKVRVVHV